MEYKKYYLFINTGYAGASHTDTVDIPDTFTKEEWDSMNEEEQKSYLDECAEDFLGNYIEWGWSEEPVDD